MRLAPVVLLVVLVLAACGGGSGGPAIDAPVAAKLARQADAVAAARTPCAARARAHALQTSTIAAINAGRIPAAYLETLQARVNEIVSELEPRCLPTPAASASTAPPPVAVLQPPRGEKAQKKRKHEHHHGHGEGD